MTLLFALLVLVLFVMILVPVFKVFCGFYGLDQAIGAWALLFIVAWVL